MIKTNLNRRLPTVELCGPSDVAVDREWEHMAVVYKILDAVIQGTSVRCTLLQSHINELLVSLLFNNATAPDAREAHRACESLSQIGHRWFRLRRYMANKLTTFLARAVDDQRSATALPHLLAFLEDSSDVLRFAESRKFFRRILCPLMTLSGFASFDDQLFQVVCRFIAADSPLLGLFVKYLITHWPVQDHEKQAAFLSGLRDIIVEFIAQMPRDVAALCIAKVASIFGDCIPELANQAISLMISDEMAAALAKLPRSVAASVWRQATAVARGHWLDSTRALAWGLIRFLEAANLGSGEAATGDRGSAEKWQIVRAMASENWNSAEMPRTDDDVGCQIGNAHVK
jgi:hypothetical protein